MAEVIVSDEGLPTSNGGRYGHGLYMMASAWMVFERHRNGYGSRPGLWLVHCPALACFALAADLNFHAVMDDFGSLVAVH